MKMLTNKIREVSKKDMLIGKVCDKIPDGYTDGAFCKCGIAVFFKNRKPYETVSIKCPKCGFKILYG